MGCCVDRKTFTITMTICVPCAAGLLVSQPGRPWRATGSSERGEWCAQSSCSTRPVSGRVAPPWSVSSASIPRGGRWPKRLLLPLIIPPGCVSGTISRLNIPTTSLPVHLLYTYKHHGIQSYCRVSSSRWRKRIVPGQWCYFGWHTVFDCKVKR